MEIPTCWDKFTTTKKNVISVQILSNLEGWEWLVKHKYLYSCDSIRKTNLFPFFLFLLILLQSLQQKPLNSGLSSIEEAVVLHMLVW